MFIVKEGGVEIEIYCLVGTLAKSVLETLCAPEELREIFGILPKAEEMIFSYVGGKKDRLPLIDLYTFHLINEPDPPEDITYHCLDFRVHKNHLLAAEELSKEIMGHFKQAYDWEETTRLEVERKPNQNLETIDLEDL